MMTVAEMIAKLQELPSDMPVVTTYGQGDDWFDAEGLQERWITRGANGYIDLAEENTPGASKAVEIV